MNKFDKQIRSKLEGSKEVPPVGSWNSIQKGLEQKEPKPFLGYKKIAAAAAIILLGLFLVDMFMPPTKVFNGISKQDMPHLGDTKTSDATADKVKFNSSTDKQSITISKVANPILPNNSNILKEEFDLDLNTSSKHQTTEVVVSDAREPAELPLNSKPSNRSIIGTSQSKKSVVDLGESGTKNQTALSKIANNSFVKDDSLNAEPKTNKFDNQLANNVKTDTENKVEANKSTNNQVAQGASSLAGNVPNSGVEEINNNSQIAVSKQNDNELRYGLELVDSNGSDLSRSQEALSIPLSPKKTVYPIFPDNVYDDLLDHEALNDLLVETNAVEEEEESSKKRFDLYAYAAPTHFDIMNGVTMPEFDGVEQDFSNTMVYGVRAGYAINSRLKLRTGLSSLQVIARSNDMFFTSNLSSGNMTSPNIQAVENSSINYTSPMQINVTPVSGAFSNEISALAINSFKGDVVQDISYLELPLELEYRLLNNKRFAVSSVAGASTFFLTQNSVIVETTRENMELGEANNLNNTSYSANLGLKLDVNLLRNIDLSVEPHFKYIMNTVNNSPGFQPYLLGVNAGLRVSF